MSKPTFGSGTRPLVRGSSGRPSDSSPLVRLGGLEAWALTPCVAMQWEGALLPMLPLLSPLSLLPLLSVLPSLSLLEGIL